MSKDSSSPSVRQISSQMKDLDIQERPSQQAQKQPHPQQKQQQKQQQPAQQQQQQPHQASKTPMPSAAKYPICPNKGAGKNCEKRVIIETNYLKLNIEKMVPTAYHYDISIEPDKPKRLLQKAFGAFRKKNFPTVFMAFDGQKNAYAPQVLDFSTEIQRETKIIDPETGLERTFMVAIQETRGSEIDLSSLRR